MIGRSCKSTRFPGPTLLPSGGTLEKVETVLAERAESLGVTILRGDGVEKFAQHGDSVTVEAGEERFRGKWLVGCDGGRSLIRKNAGFDFVGTEAKFTGYAVQCDFDNPEKLKPGFQVTKTGMYIVAPGSLYLVDFDGGAFDRSQEITKEHIQDVFNHATGLTDVKIAKIHLASSFTDRSKQATSYRKGRILLAGDAAHIHSPVGSQGLNLGLGDAMNLGWKLGATVRKESGPDMTPADFALLDTYEAERHPVGASVLELSRAQVSLMQPNMHNVHTLVREMVETTDGTNVLINRIWGLSQRYNFGDSEIEVHPLVGSSAPDFELSDGSTLNPKLARGKGLLVSFEDNAELEDLIVGGKYEARVDYVAMDAKDRLGIRALLIRPDGFVAWAVEEKNETINMNSATAALKKWFEF